MVGREIETHTHRDRQTDKKREIERQTDTQTYKQIGRQTDRQRRGIFERKSLKDWKTNVLYLDEQKIALLYTVNSQNSREFVDFGKKN